MKSWWQIIPEADESVLFIYTCHIHESFTCGIINIWLDKLTVSVRVFHICGPHFFMWRVESTVELSLQYICNVKKREKARMFPRIFPWKKRSSY